MEFLKNHFLDNLKENVSLRLYNWFKIGGSVKYFFTPRDVNDLIFFLKNKPQNLKLFVLGAGSNMLIPEGILDCCVISLKNLNHISKDDNLLYAQGGTLNISLSNFAYNNSITGFEFLSGIPGSIGGGVKMNAGAFGSDFSEIVCEVHAVDFQGEKHVFSNKEMGFSYRENKIKDFMVFYMVSFIMKAGNKNDIMAKMDNIKEERNQNQPKKVLTGGSTFANPTGYKAWQLIDSVGLRGYRIGGAHYSDKHCNFIINDNNATYDDIKALINEAKKRVKDEFNVDLKTEIQFLEI